MFAYIAGGSYALENVYGISPQAFSAVFAVNSIALAAVSQVSRRLVGRFGSRRLFLYGLIVVVLGSAAAFVVCVTHASLWLMLAALFVIVAAQGFVLPNGMAAAMASQPDSLGSAAGLIGLGQFGIGAVIAPLVGLGGAYDAVPMGIVMIVFSGVALAVNLVFVRRR
jgi:MFS transporter, DHA1 family, multidrug resistance protein